MQVISKIASRFIMFVTIASFAISTTGFTFYQNNCKHHETHNSLVSIDGCCLENQEQVSEVSQSCCSVTGAEKSKSKCGSGLQQSDCCSIDVSYVKFSESYVPSENELSYVDCVHVDIKLINDDKVDEPDIRIIRELPDIQNLRPPLYRLFNRVKIDPPLI